MRPTFALRALAVIGFVLAAGCGAPGPISPERTPVHDAGRGPAPAGDPCDPNLNPC